MNTEFGELAQAQYRARNKRRRVSIVVGLVVIVAGYFLMAVSPDTKSEWALARAVGGLLCIVVGAGMAILPLLSRDASGE
jgi:peptidoglycan/LPS O-acetylase OafA/YrhL